MNKYLLYVFCVFHLNGLKAATVSPPNNPDNPGLAVNFNWQQEWGTIHMNSFADGLMDPGVASTIDGKVPCPQGVLCNDVASLNKLHSIPLTNIDNGIKFDIKNSVLNCMSKPHPNFPTENGGWASQYSRVRCDAIGTLARYPSTNVGAPLPSGNFYPNNTSILANIGLSANKPTLVYSPIWDPRTNDERDFAHPSTPPGCLQQIINNCVEDIHDCRPINGRNTVNLASDNATANRTAGYKNPVTHVFTADEVADLGGAGKALPMRYYSYTKGVKFETGFEDVDTIPTTGQYTIVDPATITGTPLEEGKIRIKKVKPNGTRVALSRGKPDGTIALAEEQVYGTEVTTINNTGDSNLARIKSYSVTDLKMQSDISGFIIVDPKDFFDLRDYIKGGRFESGYDKFVKDKPKTSEFVQAYDSCPILGLKSGYSGICDPTGEAGCNLPVYGMGPVTTFSSDDRVFTYNNYPIKWSGYVKKWSVITVEQYLENVNNRKGVNGGQLYATQGADINDGPVLMLTRSNLYCDSRERYSGWVKNDKEPDMDCIQYKQYQDYGTVGAPKYGFVDLFQPEEDPGPVGKWALSKLRTFNTVNGKPNKDSPVMGNNENGLFLVGRFGDVNGSYVSFMETQMPYYTDRTVSADSVNSVVQLAALTRDDYITNPVRNIAGIPSIGSYIKIDPEDAEFFGHDETAHGTSMKLEKGIALGIRLPDKKSNGNQENGDYNLSGRISTRCSIVTFPPLLPDEMDKELFIPTNSHEELDAFVNAAYNQAMMSDVNSKNCAARYMKYEQLQDPTKPLENKNKTKTWIGRTSCEQLTVKPSCNQTQIITAQRYCMLEDGIQGQCDECKNVVDPDADVDFTLASVAPLGNAEILSSPTVGGSLCYFSAACFNNQAAGCPGAGGSGGHVFCLSADTMITLADGTEREIVKLKSGDKVLAFKAESSRSKELATAEVMATAITKDQPILKISFSHSLNGRIIESSIKITPEHKIVLANGRGQMAQDLRAGDVIVLKDGEKATVEEVESEKSRITVYNLILEDGFDGYIASGLRVLSYPMLKGMEESSEK